MWCRWRNEDERMSQIDSGLAANAPDVEADIQQSRLYNDDLAPVPASRRKWGMLSFAALWISMSRASRPICWPRD
jgi:cytosine/uracil/thiamine/allantoin permease